MPRPVVVYYHPDCLLHDTGPQHPEQAPRLEVCKSALEGASYSDLLQWRQAKPAPVRWIEEIHTPEYRQYIEEACLQGRHFVDTGDTIVCPDSYHAAVLAAGAAIGSIDAVLKEGHVTAFSLTRPPGHHAGVEKPMGFCLFNNIAIAANYARKAYGLDRICIIDVDVHHGNGTQDIFYGSPSVLFCSIHQLPLWPHSGESFETGTGAGTGLTLNCPLPEGAGIDLVHEALEVDIQPQLAAFNPELILVSAGFDAHQKDPLAGLSLQTDDYYEVANWILGQAEHYCQGRVVSILEGGYNLNALAASVTAYVKALVEGPI